MYRTSVVCLYKQGTIMQLTEAKDKLNNLTVKLDNIRRSL
jgi:hypothetical protein